MRLFFALKRVAAAYQGSIGMYIKKYEAALHRKGRRLGSLVGNGNGLVYEGTVQAFEHEPCNGASADKQFRPDAIIRKSIDRSDGLRIGKYYRSNNSPIETGVHQYLFLYLVIGIGVFEI